MVLDVLKYPKPYGAQLWDSDLGFRFRVQIGVQIWGADLGCRFGVQIWGADFRIRAIFILVLRDIK